MDLNVKDRVNAKASAVADTGDEITARYCYLVTEVFPDGTFRVDTDQHEATRWNESHLIHPKEK